MTIKTGSKPRTLAAAAMPPASLSPPERWALLLDLDGTLLDIAAAPECVRVPSSLPSLLARLTAMLEGALAIVSGRTVASVLNLFPAPLFVIAGEHGAAIRRADATIEFAPAPVPPASWRAALASLAARNEGVLLEEKPHGFVLHYRAAPEARAPLERCARALIARSETFVLQPARMAWEIRPRGVDKGAAVRALLAHPPFRGRAPIFVGDDTTDLDGIRAARAFGGFGFEVAPTFGDAAGVRAWLANLPDEAERGA